MLNSWWASASGKPPGPSPRADNPTAASAATQPPREETVLAFFGQGLGAAVTVGWAERAPVQLRLESHHLNRARVFRTGRVAAREAPFAPGAWPSKMRLP